MKQLNVEPLFRLANYHNKDNQWTWATAPTDDEEQPWPSAEQVEERMLSVNLSEWCLLQAKPEKCKRTALSWRQTTGSQCQSNLQPENSLQKKPWIWLCWVTDAPSHTPPRNLVCPKLSGGGGKQLTFHTFVIFEHLYSNVLHNTEARKQTVIFETQGFCSKIQLPTHLQSASWAACYTAVPFSVMLFDSSIICNGLKF